MIFAGAATAYSCNRQCKPIATEAMAIETLKPILVATQKDFPNSFKIVDLDKQISNLRVLGPQMTFDPPEMRYVMFDLDTRCDASVNLTAMFNGCGSLLNLTPIWIDRAAGGKDSRIKAR